MNFETLADWCKWLEKNFSPEIAIPCLPLIIRLDGNNFSTYTRGLTKPFDMRLTDLMIDTLKHLVKETNAVIGYTQSDEITLILYSEDRKKALYNEGKKQKIVSKLTGLCVSYFNERRLHYLPEHIKVANFDCRIYQVPTLQDACVQLLWRENDAAKNSVSMLAQSEFSHRSLDNLNSSQKQEKLFTERGINWNDLPVAHKRGTYVKRYKKLTRFVEEEISKLPLKHEARANPGFLVERNVIEVVQLPIFSKITNQEDVIFRNVDPVTL